ncbi:hypothetical protein KDA_61990 [Dictyobacter alpinus]|uniref:Uncharacterized protein n=1 Tax=Dictyobacter alpinus TaxID=2014873 RepID=A0A402BH61_9CHLR|nr:hypothetical protein KDA_61990 [Dictyobacter alpinus]
MYATTFLSPIADWEKGEKHSLILGLAKWECRPENFYYLEVVIVKPREMPGTSQVEATRMNDLSYGLSFYYSNNQLD